MKKYAFAEAEYIHEALGITEDRHEEIVQAAKEIAFKAFLIDENMNTPAKALEELINQVSPKNEVEAIFSGYVFGAMSYKMQYLAASFAEAMKEG